jgi:enoyl-CoA hydratase/carnithine racemase
MAQEALSIGLVDVLVEDDLAVDRALSWIEQCAEQAPLAVWMVKIAVNSGIDLDLCTGLTLESLLTTLAFTTEDRAEGMRAVLEKRAPRFGGI